MGEVLYFYFLIVTTKNSANEQRVIDTVLGWSPSPAEIPQELVAGLTPGIASPGQYFHTNQSISGRVPHRVRRAMEGAGVERTRPAACESVGLQGLRDAHLNFRSALLQGYPNRPRTQREALLHLVFPDTFEAIVSVDHKERVARTFAKFVAALEEDVDRQLEQIRPVLEDQYGSSDYFFYKREIRVQWDDKYKPDLWDEYVRRAQEYVDTGRLESEEIEYKIELGRKLALARESVLAGAERLGQSGECRTV